MTTMTNDRRRDLEVSKVLDRTFKAMGSVKDHADKLTFVTGAAGRSAPPSRRRL
jgi:hypothetical protein